MTALEVATTGPHLPARPDNELTQLLEAWLHSFGSVHTQRAYRNDMTGRSPKARVPSWLEFCESIGVHPLEVRRAHVDLYARGLEVADMKPRTRARKLACLASFYTYCVWEERIPASPLEHVRRPKLGNQGETPGLNQDELRRFLRAAREHGSSRTVALLTLLAFTGLRINEALSRDVEHLGHDRGHVTLSIVRKGGASAKVPLWAEAVDALEQYLAGRTTGPIFLTDGGKRMQQSEAWRMVRRIAARAELASAGQLSPHSLRATFITSAREAGVALEDVQDAVGHADPRTTRGYDRNRHSLERHPAHAIGAWLARADGQS